MYTKRAAWTLTALIALTGHGCASNGPDARFDHLIEETTRGLSTPALAVREKENETDQFGAAGSLSLDAATGAAIENNPGLTSMRHRVKEAMGKYPQATALDDPMMGFGLFPATLGASGADFSYKLDFSQRVPYPGKLRLRGSAALAEAEASLGDFVSAKLALIHMVKTAYLELWFAHRAIEINEDDLKLLRELKAIAATRYGAGEASLQDAVQADVSLVRVEHRGIVLERTLRVATARLNTLMGREAGRPLPPPGDLPSEKFSPDKAALLQAALENNPGIKSARSRIEAANASTKLAEAQSYPDFTITGSYNRAWMTDELRPFIGVTVNIPLRSERLSAERSMAAARFQRAGAELAAEENSIRLQVEEAWQRRNEARHAEKLFREVLLPEAELNFKTARGGYSAGKSDFLTLITAGRALIDTRLQYERIIVDMRIAEAMLEKLAGEAP
ncbi:MAG: TolC family protein [Candidatus Nitrospinota bacterium M3_3B_026]